jgi:hypothetical protein
VITSPFLFVTTRTFSRTCWNVPTSGRRRRLRRRRRALHRGRPARHARGPVRAVLEFALDPDTERGIGPALPSLAKVSKERISPTSFASSSPIVPHAQAIATRAHALAGRALCHPRPPRSPRHRRPRRHRQRLAHHPRHATGPHPRPHPDRLAGSRARRSIDQHEGPAARDRAGPRAGATIDALTSS